MNKDDFIFATNHVLNLKAITQKLCDFGFDFERGPAAELIKATDNAIKIIENALKLKKGEYGYTTLSWWIEGNGAYTAIINGQEFKPKTPSDLWDLMVAFEEIEEKLEK